MNPIVINRVFSGFIIVLAVAVLAVGVFWAITDNKHTPKLKSAAAWLGVFLSGFVLIDSVKRRFTNF
jgi:CDP-diglyceride synthetase